MMAPGTLSEIAPGAPIPIPISIRMQKSNSFAACAADILFNSFSTIVNELVKKIIVHILDESSGHLRQKIELVWNIIGEVNLPGDDQTVE